MIDDMHRTRSWDKIDEMRFHVGYDKIVNFFEIISQHIWNYRRKTVLVPNLSYLNVGQVGGISDR